MRRDDTVSPVPYRCSKNLYYFAPLPSVMRNI